MIRNIHLRAKRRLDFHGPLADNRTVSIFLLFTTTGGNIDDKIKPPLKQYLSEIRLAGDIADFVNQEIGNIVFHEKRVRFVCGKELKPKLMKLFDARQKLLLMR